eukprot:5415491-Pyramimonas_sp.AAC.2
MQSYPTPVTRIQGWKAIGRNICSVGCLICPREPPSPLHGLPHAIPHVSTATFDALLNRFHVPTFDALRFNSTATFNKSSITNCNV